MALSSAACSTDGASLPLALCWDGRRRRVSYFYEPTPDDALHRFRSASTALSPYPTCISAAACGTFFYQSWLSQRGLEIDVDGIIGMEDLDLPVHICATRIRPFALSLAEGFDKRCQRPLEVCGIGGSFFYQHGDDFDCDRILDVEMVSTDCISGIAC